MSTTYFKEDTLEANNKPVGGMIADNEGLTSLDMLVSASE